MKSFIAVSLAAAAALASTAQGFRIGNCRTPGDFNLGNGECHQWTDAQFTFQSDAGCTLTFYDAAGCQGATTSSTIQNQCQDVGLVSQSMRCN
ncbi:hypothetical protein F4820DRAFT_411341 [Hypoxylon rubiginosum]|uniref:Uncharacterized protein n=1 Tax=Hypoxylon rubiginosum TaxID=110542 RepID=A0ACB9ZBB6_9PEZI|nr:hypothetical protein F4820DRAFT_411341 [Hypoxylon rubiginosum]